jgi:hypothetical protein
MILGGKLINLFSGFYDYFHSYFGFLSAFVAMLLIFFNGDENALLNRHVFRYRRKSRASLPSVLIFPQEYEKPREYEKQG